MIIEQIKEVNDIKKLSDEELITLSTEIREFLIESISKTGGHLASNLGAVELTMALHLSFDMTRDKIVWDVGHQSYTHKILTGRQEGFKSLRQFGGMSGFPKTEECEADSFNTGHSSTSISAALGLAVARDLKDEDYSVVAVIGDGAMTGGLSFEALNNASEMKTNFIIILNDNNMSISENVGGMNRYLANFRTSQAYQGLKDGVTSSLKSIPVVGERMVKQIHTAKSGIKQLFVPGMYFEEMGITYLGPVDGYNIKEMRRLLEEAKRVNGPVIVHVLTRKGKGYAPAERHPARFHGIDAFDVETGKPLNKKTVADYTDVFSSVMSKMGEKEPRLVAITAAMEDGTGLKKFHNLYPERFFDVGIAEEHAVTFAAGLAKEGMKPVFAVYSSFLQRAYDQILHDVCAQKLPVVFAIDRAGLVGKDGATHQGLYDLSYLTSIPGLTVMAPKNKWELSDMIKYALYANEPVAIRYPKGEASECFKEKRTPIKRGCAEIVSGGSDIVLFAIGSMVDTAEKVHAKLRAEGIEVTVVNARFASPLDLEAIRVLANSHDVIITMEENALSGGFGEHVAAVIAREELPVQVINIAVPDCYVEHGCTDQLKKALHIDADSITELVKSRYQELENLDDLEIL